MHYFFERAERSSNTNKIGGRKHRGLIGTHFYLFTDVHMQGEAGTCSGMTVHF